jgi:nucleolar GTP-binding protein
MQAVTALAHLNACILYLIDISETCGYFLDQQIALFNSIKPLFKNKPLVVVISKTDLKKWDDLSPESKQKIEDIGKEHNAYVISMSNKNGEGITDLKHKACDILLDFRFAQKSENAGKMNAIANRLHVGIPKKRDEKDRTPHIPETVVAERQKMEEEKEGEGKKPKRKTVKEAQEEDGGAGCFNYPYEEHFQLENDEWKYDAPPEIFEGKNVADYIDPDIEEKLAALEKEEAILEQMEGMDTNEKGELEQTMEKEYKRIQGKKVVLKDHRKMRKHDLVHKKGKKIADAKEDLEKKGIDTKTIEGNIAKRVSLVDKVKKRLKAEGEEKMGDVEENIVDLKKKAVSKREGLTLERAEGYGMKKSVRINLVI